MKVRGWGWGWGKGTEREEAAGQKDRCLQFLVSPKHRGWIKDSRRVSSEELDKLEPGGKGNDEENILKLELQRGGRAKIQVGKDCRGQSKKKINYPWTRGWKLGVRCEYACITKDTKGSQRERKSASRGERGRQRGKSYIESYTYRELTGKHKRKSLWETLRDGEKLPGTQAPKKLCAVQMNEKTWTSITSSAPKG